MSKLSAVEVTVTRPDGKLVFDRLATFRRGVGAFTWTPRGPGLFTVRVGGQGAAHRASGKRDSDSAEIEVENRPG